MYTELELQTGIQTTLLSLSEFSAGDVVINDWTIFDKQTLNSPYVIIGNCPDPILNYRDQQHIWTFPLIVASAFNKTWETTENDLRDARQAIITLFETDGYEQLGLNTAGEGLELRQLNARTEFLPWYDPGLTDQDIDKTTIPLFMFQELSLTLENF